MDSTGLTCWGVFECGDEGNDILLALYHTEAKALDHAEWAQRDADMKGWPVQYAIEEWDIN